VTLDLLNTVGFDSVENYCCANFQVIPFRVCFYHANVCTHSSTLIHTPWQRNHKISLHFNVRFSRRTFVSRCLLKQRMMEAVVTTGAISRAKLQSNNHHQQTNIQFFYRPDALPVAQPTVSKH